MHESETGEFILPITNGNGQFEEISDNELNLSLSPLKTSDFCDVQPPKKRRNSYCPSSASPSVDVACCLRRTKSLSSVNVLSDGDVYIRRLYPRRSPIIFNSTQFLNAVAAESRVNIETVDVLGYKLPLVAVHSDNGLDRFVCVSDVYQTFFSRRHWDEFKEILAKNGIQPVFGVVKNAYDTYDDVNAITVNQCQTLLLNNQARKDGFVRCIRLSLDGQPTTATMDAGPSSTITTASTTTPCSLTPTMTPACGETKLILASERQVGELSSGIKTRHADQSDILYVEFDGKTLPSITINDRQYVRLVDVQRNILTPDVGAVQRKQFEVLKNVCDEARIDVGKCRPNEKSRLVVYANSFRSNSLHVIAAEDLPRLIAYYYEFEKSAKKKKYLKLQRRRTLDDGVGGDDDLIIDFSSYYSKRFRLDDSGMNLFNRSSTTTFYSADSSEPSPLSRPSSVSTDTASCSGESVTQASATPMMPMNNNYNKKLLSSSQNSNSSTVYNWSAPSIGEIGMKTKYVSERRTKPKTALAPITSASSSSTTTTQATTINRNNFRRPAPTSKKSTNSFEQMLASADEFYKTKPLTKQKGNKNDTDGIYSTDANSSPTTNFHLDGVVNSKTGKKKSTSRDVSNSSTSKRRSKYFSSTPAQFSNGAASSSFDADDKNKTTNYLTHSLANNNFAKLSKKPSLSFNKELHQHHPHHHHHHHSQILTAPPLLVNQQPPTASPPPPCILPEISYHVNPDDDFDLARNETLMEEILINSSTRPCSIYLGKSAPLPVAVYNRHFQRGPAGYYHDHLFVNRWSECILCCVCKKFMSLRYFIQHAHGGGDATAANTNVSTSSLLVEPLLFMFVRNPTTDRFDLWRNLCMKAKQYGLHKYINYNLPDDLAEYYEERRYALRNTVIEEQNQKEARSTAAILLSLSRGK